MGILPEGLQLHLLLKADSLLSSAHMADTELASVQHSLFNNIPEACNILCIGASFVGAVHFYTDRQVQLQHLKMQCCGPDSKEHILKLPSLFPDLRHLLHLKTLQLHAAASQRTGTQAGSLPQLVQA